MDHPVNILVFRLSNFNIIIGEIIGEDESYYQLRYPMEMVSDYSFENGFHELLLIDYQPFTDDEIFNLPKNLIISKNLPRDNIQTYYIQRIDDIYNNTYDVFSGMDIDTKH